MTAGTGEAQADAPAGPRLRTLFLAFAKVGALGFGGVGPLARHVIVVEKGMLDERAYAETFGIASTLPGANTVNLATMLGDRFRGPLGALVAVSGLMGPPLGIVVLAALFFARYGGNPDVRAALSGAAAAAAGLVAGTSYRLLQALTPDIATIVALCFVCLASAVFKLPMLLILAIVVPCAVMIGLRRRDGSQA